MDVKIRPHLINLLVPDFLQKIIFQSHPIIPLFADVRGRARVRSVNQLQDMSGLPSFSGETVPAGHAVSDVRGVRAGQTQLGHLMGYLFVSVGCQAAVAAAGRAVAGILGFRDFHAKFCRDGADRLLGRVVAPGAAGIVHRDRPVQTFAALRQADLQKDIPDALHFQSLMALQFLHAGGTAGNHDRRCAAAELLQLPVNKLLDRVVQFIASGPVADGSAAAEHQGDTSLQSAA